ncbi:MAG: hypothetical protein ACK5HY_13320 [Parahaliea sp.]
MITRLRQFALAAACCLLLATGAFAGEAGASSGEQSAGIEAFGDTLSDEQLGQLRGGFTDRDGLRFAFTFDRVTRLNGEALSQVSVVLPVFNLVNGQTANALGSASSALFSSFNALSMSDTSAVNGAALSGLPVFIQNAIDSQHIQNFTLINLDILGASTLRGGMIHQLIETGSIQSLNP